MGVYICGMGMPEDGCHHIICIYADGTVATGRREYRAVPVPPHGRLIDADALLRMCKEMQGIEWNNKASPYSWAYAYENFEDDIEYAPTIIPAEGGTK